jgi:hypothetical protein
MPTPATLAALPADESESGIPAASTERRLPVGKRALGWVLEEEPPSAWFNWFMFYTGEYIRRYKSAVAALYDDKLSRHGGVVDGECRLRLRCRSETSRDASIRLQTLFAGSVDLITLLPSYSGAAVGTSLRPFGSAHVTEGVLR